MTRWACSFAVVVATWGCGGDPAPDHADPDHDFLDNEAEKAKGTDPKNADTDGDGYLDGDEVLEGTDPTDPASRIYTGGWPYNRFKDQIVDPGYAEPPAIGKVMPRFVAHDQFGEAVDLYDFAGNGKPVVIDLSAGWCGACRELAAWLDGQATSLPAAAEYPGVPALVESGEIYWVTVYFQDGAASPADDADAVAWFKEYPNPKIAVLADADQTLFDWLWPGGYPNLQVLREDMTIEVYDRFKYQPALDTISK